MSPEAQTMKDAEAFVRKAVEKLGDKVAEKDIKAAARKVAHAIPAQHRDVRELVSA